MSRSKPKLLDRHLPMRVDWLLAAYALFVSDFLRGLHVLRDVRGALGIACLVLCGRTMVCGPRRSESGENTDR